MVEGLDLSAYGLGLKLYEDFGNGDDGQAAQVWASLSEADFTCFSQNLKPYTLSNKR